MTNVKGANKSAQPQWESDFAVPSPGTESPRPGSRALFPIFLKIEGRTCLVVGAGRVGEEKILGLLAARASIRVVAPQATEPVLEWARQGRVTLIQRPFEPPDLDGVLLAVVSTASPELNHRIFRLAEERRVLCNVVDDPLHCDFYYPAVVQRGDLQIAVSTNGKSPALAQRLRRDIEQQYGPVYEKWLTHLGQARKSLYQSPIDPAIRRQLLHRLASKEEFDTFVRQNEVSK